MFVQPYLKMAKYMSLFFKCQILFYKCFDGFRLFLTRTNDYHDCFLPAAFGASCLNSHLLSVKEKSGVA